MRMSKDVAIIGATGYAGGELCRVLVNHPGVCIKHLMGASSVGDRMGDYHPHIPQLADRVIEETDMAVAALCDVVFFALPHGQSGQLTAKLRSITTDVTVIDVAADHRLRDGDAWRTYYGSEPNEPWVYGMPELVHADGTKQREAIKEATEIAVPGCNVTAVTLATQPALINQLISMPLTATLAVGYSGAGKKMKPHLMASAAFDNAVPYSVGGTHRHTPEIVQNLQELSPDDVTVTLTPVLVPISRGILATITAPLTPQARQLSNEELTSIFTDFYADEPLISVCPSGTVAQLAGVIGSPRAVISVCADKRAGQIVINSAIDNLTKGTATQAVQAMNLALGLDELTGLPLGGLNP